MSNNGSSVPRKRRPKKVLSPSAKYEIWLRLVRGEVTISQAASQAEVDRSTIIRLRQVAKDGVRCFSVNVRFGRLDQTTSGWSWLG
ncbi:hypothetical protein ACSL103130_05920 [Actinomyces slackii]|uniref:Uncharacterized protein n=1 Tax=Actinomyces slackii TaxID=52774 RepID=A0A448KE41_9ACTO|nr:Uncharacterised protein [Actinomyces slackii]VEG75193.1 Uncharacterised protein [Actinomyces slackii]